MQNPPQDEEYKLRPFTQIIYHEAHFGKSLSVTKPHWTLAMISHYYVMC